MHPAGKARRPRISGAFEEGATPPAGRQRPSNAGGLPPRAAKVEISRTAEKQLRKLEPDDQRRVARAMMALGNEPRPPGSRKLAGYDDVFRIRVGRYRIIYSVEDRRLVVIILKLGHRKDVYR